MKTNQMQIQKSTRKWWGKPHKISLVPTLSLLKQLQQQNYWSHRVPPICPEQNKKKKLRSKFVPNVATTDTKKHVGVSRWSQQLHLHWLCLTTRPQLHPCPDLRSAAPLAPDQLFYTPKVNNPYISYRTEKSTTESSLHVGFFALSCWRWNHDLILLKETHRYKISNGLQRRLSKGLRSTASSAQILQDNTLIRLFHWLFNNMKGYVMA